MSIFLLVSWAAFNINSSWRFSNFIEVSRPLAESAPDTNLERSGLQIWVFVYFYNDICFSSIDSRTRIIILQGELLSALLSYPSHVAPIPRHTASHILKGCVTCKALCLFGVKFPRLLWYLAQKSFIQIKPLFLPFLMWKWPISSLSSLFLCL